MPLTSGARLGTYEIVGPLGAGGMGEVYRAKDLRLRRDIALKVLPHDLATDPERVARFEREARTVAGLNHPNIVVLYSVDEEDGVRFLTMELVEGATLDKFIQPGGLLLERVLDLGIALADALTAAHERGVVHRDLKPANVMLTPEGRVKVLDFGIAKLAPSNPEFWSSQLDTREASVSTVGVVVGTVPYMAPEQIRSEAVDARTDLFALGVLLYELAAGCRPFPGATFVDVSHSILHDVPAPLSSLRVDVPGELERIVERCLEKNRRDRVQTALDVGNELRRLKRSLERGEPLEPSSHKVASIAVLPFVNRSRDEEDEYFSDGLADELLNMLAKIRGLRVAARSSAFTFKGRQVSVSEVGSALNVATVLEGSVRKAGNRVRISVQLVKVADGYHLWSETYDRTLEDIFQVQDEIAHSVVKELRATLLGERVDSEASGQVKAEVAKAARGRGTDPEAHRLYLMARHFLDRFTREDTAKATEYLKQSLEKDPTFALAWAELGGVHTRSASWGWASPEEGYGRARQAVERSLALEPDLAEGHAQLGAIQISYDWDWAGAEASFSRALELAPGSAQVLRLAVHLARTQNRLEEAIGLYHRSLEQDPLSAAGYHGLGDMFHVTDRLAEAEQAYRKSLELAPHRAITRARLSLTLLALGLGEEALIEAKRESEDVYRLRALAIVHHAMGHEAESSAALLELIERHGVRAPDLIADVYSARGDANAAFEWLERAYARRDPGLIEMRSNPRFRPLHGDPRWGAFLKKMGFVA